jgi:hypothetical protein
VLTDSIVAVFCDDWRKHGAASLEKLRETSVATYCKLAVMLVPRDIRVEHHNPVGDLSNEQLDLMIATLTEQLEEKANGAKLVLPENPEEELAPARSQPKPKRLALTAIGPQERKPRKRVLPPPGA